MIFLARGVGTAFGGEVNVMGRTRRGGCPPPSVLGRCSGSSRPFDTRRLTAPARVARIPDGRAGSAARCVKVGRRRIQYTAWREPEHAALRLLLDSHRPFVRIQYVRARTARRRPGTDIGI